MPKLSKLKSKGAGIGILILVIMAGVGIYAFTAGSEGWQGGAGVEDTLPIYATVYSNIEQANIASATIKVYESGVLRETLTSASTGTIAGSVQYSTGEDLFIIVLKSNYATMGFQYVVPKNTKNFDYWPLPVAELEPLAAAGEVTETILTSGMAAPSAGLTIDSTTNYAFVGFLVINVGTDHHGIGVDWYDPTKTVTYHEHMRYAKLTLNTTCNGFYVDGFLMSDNKLDFFYQVTEEVYYDASANLGGTLIIPFTAHFPTDFHLSITPGYITDQDPAQMQTGAFNGSPLLSDTGSAMTCKHA